MSHPIEFIATDGPAGTPALPSSSARSQGDFGFAEALDAASAARGIVEVEGKAPPAAVTAYNNLNLLNGKFPPPDSGAGFIFTEVTLQQEEI